MKVGEQLGQYVVVEHIGRGGMADVWSARDERLHRTVAIKTIMADLSDEATRSRFEHEAHIIAALEHPHILPIYDFGEFQRQLYIVMRYVPGGSLLDRIVEQGGLPDAEVLRIGEAIAMALERAHTEKIVHRDLKPANVLLDRFGTPYLADFGLAAVVGLGEEENVSSGTLIYMPPEQMFGQPVDHRADVYAFAIMLFQMITGEFPFGGEGALCLRQVQNGEELPDIRRYRPDLPEQVMAPLRIATAMDVNSRFDSAMLLMTEVSASIQGQAAAPSRIMTPEGEPRQEAIPYEAPTEAAVDEDLIMTMRGPVDEALLRTTRFDSATVDAHVAPSEAAAEPVPGVPLVEEVEADAGLGEQPGLQEARQLFQRMVRAWARGQGRFLTGATHFANIHDYYSQPGRYELELDEAGREAMLRGAVEHNYALDVWLAQVPDVAVRRMVFVHALRSDLAAARALAVQLLRDVPDSDLTNIALTVSRLLHSETSVTVRRAVVGLLAHRATRASVWREYAYSRDTDLLLAEQAMRSDAPDVAEMAARTIGRLHSQIATSFLAAQAAQGSDPARAALVWIRDEADNLPARIPLRQRAGAFATLTLRYLSANIGRLGLRFFTALLGTGIALGVYVNAMFPSSSILQLAHLYRVVGNAQTFGLVAGLGGMLAAALPLRLAGSSAYRPRGEGATLWPWWARLLMGLIFGTLIGAIAYLNFQVLALQFNDPKLEVVLLGGLGLALGAAAAATFRWPTLVRIAASAATIFASLYLAYWLNLQGVTDALIFLRSEEQIWLFLLMAVLGGIGIFGPEVIDAGRALWRRRSA